MAQITLNSTGVASNGSLVLQSNGTTTAVTVDTAQNVGVGATPSAWGSTAKAVQLPNGCAIANLGAGDVVVTQNAYFDNPNFKYASTTGVGSSVYRQIDGTHRWSYSASGTAGNNITFTEAMRIDTSGNLLVGTTSADGRITANASTSNASSSVLVGNTSSGNTLIRIRADGLYNLGLQTNSPYNFTSTGANAILFSDGTFGRATSSLKYKRNVETATHGLSDVLKLRSVTYKSKNERDGETIFGGLIAEEVHEIGLTEFVQYAEDGTPDSLYYANMVSLCIKAIQEQQALITQLQADVAALKGASA